MDSVFNKFTIDRNKINWEDYLSVITPIEKVGEMYFKREDYFAPLGYGGINGSKLRQAIWLLKEIKSGTIISGASIKSPQLPMSSAVAEHFGLDSIHIIGATKPETAILHENVKMATWFGAKFKIVKVGYNPFLQREVDRLIFRDKTFHKLNYGITCKSENIEDIVNFHMLGASQTENIPDFIEDLIIPAGSCNSCISVIMGIMLFKPVSLKRLHLVGISPNKISFINERLKLMSLYLKENLLNFNKKFDFGKLECLPGKNSIDLYYYDLNGTGWTTYQDEVKFNYNSIEFHPTYEGKCFSYLSKVLPNLIKETSLFWIIGSKPFIKNMIDNYNVGVPNKICLYE